eukprot:scaffold9197_cov77-Skeletonema_dohrnii-CCMP3373.AAC.2
MSGGGIRFLGEHESLLLLLQSALTRSSRLEDATKLLTLSASCAEKTTSPFTLRRNGNDMVHGGQITVQPIRIINIKNKVLRKLSTYPDCEAGVAESWEQFSALAAVCKVVGFFFQGRSLPVTNHHVHSTISLPIKKQEG